MKFQVAVILMVIAAAVAVPTPLEKESKDAAPSTSAAEPAKHGKVSILSHPDGSIKIEDSGVSAKHETEDHRDSRFLGLGFGFGYGGFGYGGFPYGYGGYGYPYWG